MTFPDCYACVYRKPIPGNAHSECRHPSAGLEAGIAYLSSAMAALGAADPAETVGACVAGSPDLEIRFAAHGVRNNWATWPLNYDPVWLRVCTGWTPKPSPEVTNVP